jgi:hypothetical protein
MKKITNPPIPFLCTFLMLLLLVFFSSCKNDSIIEPEMDMNASDDVAELRVPRPNITFVVLTDFNTLLTYNTGNTYTPQKKVAIGGLASDEKILAIDYRPATGQLYGVSSASRIYVLNPETGMARAIGTAAFSPALNGTIVGFDFNPTVDRIRLVTNNGQNLRLNPETGTVAATDANLNPGTPSVVGVAYTNNKAGATTTTLYDIDIKSDKLFKQDPPNNGTLVEVGRLRVNAQGGGGFDITTGDMALAALKVWGVPFLYQIDLTSGHARRIGRFDRNLTIIGLAIPTEPVAYAVDGSNNLLIFNPLNPTPVSKPITGLQSGEQVLGLDMRPVNGQLYALGSNNRIYTINASSGAATIAGVAAFNPPLNGTAVGFDFNPTVDRIRIVTNTGQNLRANPNDGSIVAIDGNLNPGNPAVSGASYTNNFAGATTTTLYVLDAMNKKLFIQNPPNNGTLVPVGDLDSDFTSGNGFDVGGTSGKAYALLNKDGVVRLYEVNLQTAKLSTGVAFPAASVRGFALGLGF